MNNLFQGFEFVKVFLDDIFIFSKSKHEHKAHVMEVLKTLKEHSLTISIEKTSFFENEVAYLGCKISEQGIKST